MPSFELWHGRVIWQTALSRLPRYLHSHRQGARMADAESMREADPYFDGRIILPRE